MDFEDRCTGSRSPTAIAKSHGSGAACSYRGSLSYHPTILILRFFVPPVMTAPTLDEAVAQVMQLGQQVQALTAQLATANSKIQQMESNSQRSQKTAWRGFVDRQTIDARQTYRQDRMAGMVGGFYRVLRRSSTGDGRTIGQSKVDGGGDRARLPERRLTENRDSYVQIIGAINERHSRQ